jgi:cytochrome c oxidase subunit II
MARTRGRQARVATRRLLVFFAVAALAGAGCSGTSPSILDTKSADAARISRLWWLLLSIATVVFAIVVTLLVMALRRRKKTYEAAEATRRGERLIIWGGIILPAIVLVSLFSVVLVDINALGDPNELPGDALTIHITGYQWWWEVQYPGSDAVTANEIHVPVGEHIRVELTSGDVIHSFWVPQLGPKRDLIPGKVNEIVLTADEAGTYRGVCAEFCGVQHANMQMLVIAEPRADFEAWLANEAQPAIDPTSPETMRGQEVFLSGPCAGCHTIRGVSELGHLGPDLTHIGNRSTFAAGVIENTPANLATWIRDPNQMKPGVSMPSDNTLSDSDLAAVAAYLESLR